MTLDGPFAKLGIISNKMNQFGSRQTSNWMKTGDCRFPLRLYARDVTLPPSPHGPAIEVSGKFTGVLAKLRDLNVSNTRMFSDKSYVTERSIRYRIFGIFCENSPEAARVAFGG